MPAKPSTSRDYLDSDYAQAVDSGPVPRRTSITAHTVLTVSVNMSMAEMDTLVDSLGRAHDELNETERNVCAEFAAAVQALR